MSFPRSPKRIPGPTKTPGPSKTASPSKISSLSKTTGPGKTPGPSKASIPSKTTGPSKTPGPSKTSSPRISRPTKIPSPSRQTRINPRPLSPQMFEQKTTSSQTEAYFPLDKAGINFNPRTLLSKNETAIEKEYTKAISFINSCHEEFNREIKEKHPDLTGNFLLPLVVNYTPLFSYLTRNESKKESPKETKKRMKAKSCTPKEARKLSPNPSCDNSEKTNTDNNENKATTLPNYTDYDAVKQHLELLTKMYLLQKSTEIEKMKQNRELPSTSRQLQDVEKIKGSRIESDKDEESGSEESGSEESGSEESEDEESENEGKEDMSQDSESEESGSQEPTDDESDSDLD